MRALVALRAAGVFSIEQRGHIPSPAELTTPQNGQTNCPSRASRMCAASDSSAALTTGWVETLRIDCVGRFVRLPARQASRSIPHNLPKFPVKGIHLLY